MSKFVTLPFLQKNEFMFAVLITDHHLFGYIFQPYMLEEKNLTFYTLSELMTTKNRQYLSLPTEERELVELCEAYSENNILKMFSREKMTFSDFVKRCEKNPKECDRFMPFIAKTNYKVASYLMAHNKIPLFFKKNYVNIYPADRIKISSEYTRPVASFELVKEGTAVSLLYSLKVFQGEESIRLKNTIVSKSDIMLSNEPGCAVIKDHLCLFESLNYSKLTPFFSKEHVKIEGPLLDNYMHTFVRKSIQEGNVIATGFEIVNEQYTVKPILRVIEDLGKKVAIQLDFQYGDFVIKETETNARIVKENHTDGTYKFHLLTRDLEGENKYRNELISIGLKPFNCFYYHNAKATDGRSELHELIDFLLLNKSRLEAFDIKQENGDNTFLLVPVQCSLSIADENIDWFEINGNVQIGNFSIPFYKFRKHIISGNREYTLPDGTIALLPEEWFAKYSSLLTYAKEEDEKLHIHRIYFNILGEFSPLPAKQFEAKLEQQVETPAGVMAELRSYQKVGYSWLVSLYENNFGGCLADDMGLGKTLQFLTFFQYVYYGITEAPKPVKVTEQKQIEWPYANHQPTLFDQIPMAEPVSVAPALEKRNKPASLIVLPTSLLFNWQREKEKFAPHLKSLTYSGSKRVRSKDIGRIFNHYDLVFTTYGILRNDIEYIKDYNFECVVLDESQNIKNPDSINYRTVIELKANHHFIISGTPIENSLKDLWAQMNFANRNIFGSQNNFNKHFILPITKQQNEERKQRLQQLIKPYILRRTKAEVAKDLPPVVEQTIFCEMTEAHRKIYDREKSSLRNNILDSLSNGDNQTMLAITALLRLRQLSNHPALVMDDYEGDSSKLEEVVSRIESLHAENHKVLIFSSFVKHLNMVADRLDKLGIRYELLTGETTHREAVINNFQNDKEICCFLISLKAGGVGLNLMAADYVFLLDPWWNPAAESQAINRAHRIGQEKTVMVYRFIMSDTIEEKIQNLQSDKSKLAQTFINSNNPFVDISLETLEKLFH